MHTTSRADHGSNTAEDVALGAVARWSPGPTPPAWTAAEIGERLAQIREPAFIIIDPASGRRGLATGGSLLPTGDPRPAWPCLAALPAIYPEWLGDRSFGEAHRVRFPYVVGEMANGIATVEMTIAAARAGCVGFFGAAGLAPERVEAALTRLVAELGPGHPGWGVNLIHSPSEPRLEAEGVELMLRHGVPIISCSAFMKLTPAVVRASASGLRQRPDGTIERARAIFAKVSRVEVARRFLEPAPADLLAALVEKGQLSAEEARLARLVPVAEDITAEADSGGHTDNQALPALLPTLLALRDRVQRAQGYRRPIRIGAAGGLGTPGAVAGAFALGADYVLTGSVNQAALEAGLSPAGKQMLAAAGLADVVMAPAADMFELGVEVQVLSRGTMFAARGKRLSELYKAHPSLDALPPAEKKRLETEVLRCSIEEAWESTKAFWLARDPREVSRAERDPRHKMALVLRSYLGQASAWAIRGTAERRVDFQIWCGPAMGAFNAWVEGSFLEALEHRSTVQIAYNLLEGAAVISRAQQLRTHGLPVPAAAFDFRPRPLV